MSALKGMTPQAFKRDRSGVLDSHLDEMDEEDRELALKWLTEPNPHDQRLYAWSAEAVAQTLSRAGFPVGETTVQRWRRAYRAEIGA